MWNIHNDYYLDAGRGNIMALHVLIRKRLEEFQESIDALCSIAHEFDENSISTGLAASRNTTPKDLNNEGLYSLVQQGKEIYEEGLLLLGQSSSVINELPAWWELSAETEWVSIRSSVCEAKRVASQYISLCYRKLYMMLTCIHDYNGRALSLDANQQIVEVLDCLARVCEALLVLCKQLIDELLAYVRMYEDARAAYTREILPLSDAPIAINPDGMIVNPDTEVADSILIHDHDVHVDVGPSYAGGGVTENRTICPNCGSIILLGQGFCCKCGMRIDACDLPLSPAPTLAVAGCPTAPLVSDVHFVVLSPSSLVRKSYGHLDIVMHEAGYEYVVKQFSTEYDEPIRSIDGSWARAAHGTKVTVKLTSEELGPIGVDSQIWQGRYLRFMFMLAVPADALGQVSFVAEVSFEDVPATKLSFFLACANEGERVNEQKTVPQRRDIKTAFASYSSKDRRRVATLVQGMCAVRRDLQVFLDVTGLRAGEKWKEELVKEIDNRDVLLLFWSRNAKASKWVDFEWRHAYATKGLSGIQPVPVEPAFLCSPPDELKSMHFSDSLHYIIYAPEGW